MIIFLYGKDTYRAREKIKEIVFHYKKKHKSGLNLKYFDCLEKEFSFKEMEEGSFQFSMFKEKKLYVILNPFSKKKELEEKLDNFLKSEDIFLLYEKEADEKENIFKLLKEKASSQEFSLLKGPRLKRWIRAEFEKFQKEINEKALDFFALSVESDLWRARNEVVKIASFSDKKEIREEDIKAFLKPALKNEIFKTIDAIAEKDKKKAIKLIHFHIEKGEPLPYILSMIAYQFRNIIIVKDLIEREGNYAAALKKSKMRPFIFKKAYGQSLKFSLFELKKIYHRLTRADLEIKTGKAGKEMAIELLLADI